jgi:hypothetical protein
MVSTVMHEATVPYSAPVFHSSLSLNIPQRPAEERTVQNMERALSMAAYRVLKDLFNNQDTSATDALLQSQGIDLNYV